MSTIPYPISTGTTGVIPTVAPAAPGPHHPLVARLLAAANATTAAPPSLDTWAAFVDQIDRALTEADQVRDSLERSLGQYHDLKRRSATELAQERERLVESYAMLRATLEAANDGIVVVDRQNTVVATNERFGEITNITRELRGTGNHANIIARAARNLGLSETQRHELERVHHTNETVRDILGPLPDGRVLDRYTTPIELADGTTVGRVTFLRDVTVERRATEEIEQARAAAEAASHAKSMFLATMSHELRTPLNAVIGLSDLLLLDAHTGDGSQEPELNPQQIEYVESIAQSGRHLLALVNDLLDLAKIEAGKTELDLEDVPLCDAVDEGLSALVPLAAHRGVHLASEPPREQLEVHVDRLRLRQVLYNLISNAVKFTNRGGTVTVRWHRATVDSVAIEVIDNGIGIARNDLNRLYRAFEQFELPSGDRPTGTGLGLALSKRLVEMHAGTIEVESTRGIGTKFTVYLPAGGCE